MAQDYASSELKAWEKAASGHFFDDIDAVLNKLNIPHPDELVQYYECDNQAIDPLSPEISDIEDDDNIDDNSDNLSNEQMIVDEDVFLNHSKVFDYIDDDFLKFFQSSYVDVYFSNIPDMCPDDYARNYKLNFKILSNQKCTNIFRKKGKMNHAKRLFTLQYELDSNRSKQLYSLLAYSLKHKFSTYKALIQDFLSGYIDKQLFENVLVKLFRNSTNSTDINRLFDLHNSFILSLWPDFEKDRDDKAKNLKPFAGVDLKCFAKFYKYQKRKRTQATFSDLFHSEIPEFQIDNINDVIDYSVDINNLSAYGMTKHQKSPTLFLNTKHYMDIFWKQNNFALPDPSLIKQPNEQLDKQMMILKNIWLTELTQSYRIESNFDTFKRFNISRGRFGTWLEAQIKHFLLRQQHQPDVRFVDIRIQTPYECDEDYSPMLFSLRKLSFDKLFSDNLSAKNDKKLLSYRNLELRFNETIAGDMKSNKILFINKQAIELCYVALMQFINNIIKEMVKLKPSIRNINKKFDRLRIVDGIVPKARTEYYPDLVREVYAKNLDDILISDEERQFSQNIFYRSMLENEHFDILRNPLNNLDLLAALQNSHTIVPNRRVWRKIKMRLLSKFLENKKC